jgi:hypothetical protein
MLVISRIQGVDGYHNWMIESEMSAAIGANSLKGALFPEL